jgi:hypothetical protein
MYVVTQNCERGIGGKAVWANRKSVSKKWGNDLIQEWKVTRMNNGTDLWETAFLQMIWWHGVRSLRTAGEGSVMNSEPGFEIIGEWDSQVLGVNHLHFLQYLSGQLLCCAWGKHPHSKHLNLADGGRMFLWKIGIHLRDHMLWKLAKQLNEIQCHGIPDSMQHALQFVITLLNQYHYSKCIVIANCKRCNGNVILVHAVKAHRGSRGIFPLILNLSTRWRWEASFMRCPLYPEYTFE